MPYFEACIWILMGLITGSFVNVCIDRLPMQFADKELRSRLLKSSELSSLLKNHVQDRTLTLFKPTRSFCFYCGHQLLWFENVPLLSYIFIKGRCRTCNAALGSRLFWTETMHGLWYGIFGWLFQNWIWSLFAGINFSFLWILGHCWNCQKARMTLFFTGFIILLFNLGIYLILK